MIAIYLSPTIVDDIRGTNAHQVKLLVPHNGRDEPGMPDLGRELCLSPACNEGELCPAVLEVRVHHRVQVGNCQHKCACICML